jgi:hypothetical protein
MQSRETQEDAVNRTACNEPPHLVSTATADSQAEPRGYFGATSSVKAMSQSSPSLVPSSSPDNQDHPGTSAYLTTSLSALQVAAIRNVRNASSAQTARNSAQLASRRRPPDSSPTQGPSLSPNIRSPPAISTQRKSSKPDRSEVDANGPGLILKRLQCHLAAGDADEVDEACAAANIGVGQAVGFDGGEAAQAGNWLDSVDA